MSGYRVEELIGTGSSGEVWRGRVNSTGIAVALKRIWLSDAAQREAALAEAALLRTLDHPHLMTLHDLRRVGEDSIVLVLDYAGGGSLAGLLARRGRLTVGEVITAIAPVGAALACAHVAGVVHGDVSAANILFTDIGLPLLADLGVSRLLGDAFPARTTPAYADPAVARGGLPTPASDVFMLGGVALHALTGAPPWPGGAAAEVFAAAAAGEPPDFAAQLAAAGIPEPVAAVVVRALAVGPPYRGTAAEFALDLRHAADPVAVELTAGRMRRMADELGGYDGTSGRSTYDRLPLTEGVRAPSPFGGATPRHLARGRPRVSTGLAVLVALLAAVAAAVLWWPFGGSPAGPAAHQAPPVRPTPDARVAQPADRASLDARAVRRLLAHLDALRSAAYARRDPALLAEVYASPVLLRRDRDQLERIVPAGCGLRGVRTSFAALRVTAASTGRVAVQAQSALRPSLLVCGAAPTARAPGTAAAPVRIELVEHDGRYRIADQRAA
jgi:hypothetical protein